jgi:hypothetical protein
VHARLQLQRSRERRERRCAVAAKRDVESCGLVQYCHLFLYFILFSYFNYYDYYCCCCCSTFCFLVFVGRRLPGARVGCINLDTLFSILRAPPRPPPPGRRGGPLHGAVGAGLAPKGVAGSRGRTRSAGARRPFHGPQVFGRAGMNRPVGVSLREQGSPMHKNYIL